MSTSLEPLDLIYLAAASLRAGKMGSSKEGTPPEAWQAAIREALLGYVTMLENATKIQGQLQAGGVMVASQSNGAPEGIIAP